MGHERATVTGECGRHCRRGGFQLLAALGVTRACPKFRITTFEWRMKRQLAEHLGAKAGLLQGRQTAPVAQRCGADASPACALFSRQLCRRGAQRQQRNGRNEGKTPIHGWRGGGHAGGGFGYGRRLLLGLEMKVRLRHTLCPCACVDAVRCTLLCTRALAAVTARWGRPETTDIPSAWISLKIFIGGSSVLLPKAYFPIPVSGWQEAIARTQVMSRPSSESLPTLIRLGASVVLFRRER